MNMRDPFLLPTDSSQFYLTASRPYAEYFRQGGLQPTLSVFGVTRSTDLLLYADRTTSTLQWEAHDRKYAFPPEHITADPALRAFLTGRQGWQVDTRRRLVKMPSEDFCWEVQLDRDLVILKARPAQPNRDEVYNYHLEFRYKLDSDLAHWYNWISLYITPEWGHQLLKWILERTGYTLSGDFDPDRFHWEPKQTTGKREDLVYTMVPPSAYAFTYAGFTLAEEFLRHNGFAGEIPAIVYHPSMAELGPNARFTDFQPRVKVGVVKTSQVQGDYERHMQLAIKLAQVGARQRDGSRVRGALKRLNSPLMRNILVMPYREFAEALALALRVTGMPDFFESKIGGRNSSGVQVWRGAGNGTPPAYRR